MPGGWGLRLRILLFFGVIAVGGIAAIAGGLALGYRRLGDPSALPGLLTAGIVAALGLIGLLAWIWLLFDENVAKPLDRLASDLRALAHAEVETEIDRAPARYLGDLAPAAAEAAARLGEARSALNEAVERQTARIATENARLAAILRDVPAGVVLCAPDHRIVLYNAQSEEMLEGAGHHLGLDRSLLDLLREGPLLHAQNQLLRTPGADRHADLLCATSDGSRLLQGRMRLLGGSADTAPEGYVLTLHDVTADLQLHGSRESLLRDLVEQMRRPAANMQTSLEVLADTGLSEEQRARLQPAIEAEARGLVEAITEAGRRYEAGTRTWWPMADVPANDIADSFRADLATDGWTVAADCASLLLHCDAYVLVQLLTDAARTFGRDEVRLAVSPDGTGALIDLEWRGPSPSVEDVDRWLARPLGGAWGSYSGRDALDSHGTELWPEAADGGARLRLPIRAARPEAERVISPRRAEFYDFSLLSVDDRVIHDARKLEELSYVVFDTETTGLDPLRDAIVQIAAVRIVNDRILRGESLDILVDPGRPIPPPSTEIHGITDAMVAGAPDIAEAGRRLHTFCADAVLVAHNAPFDMAFLRRHEPQIGASFTQPVLDTVLISAVLYGPTAEHSLDALAARLGVTIDPAARHTALGDAEATAQVLIKLMHMLRETGVVSLGQIMDASRKRGRQLRVVA